MPVEPTDANLFVVDEYKWTVTLQSVPAVDLVEVEGQLDRCSIARDLVERLERVAWSTVIYGIETGTLRC